MIASENDCVGRNALNWIGRIYAGFVSECRKIPDLTERWADRLVFVFIFVYGVIFSGYTIFMYYAFKTYGWDLGIFSQSFWTTLNTGSLFHYTLEAYVNPSNNFFGAHFSPILFLVVPFYAIYQSPLTLLVLQSFVIGLAALPLYWIARDKLNSKLWGLTFAAAFLMQPALQGMNCFDFHVEAFIPLFFLLSFYYLDNGHWIKGLLFALLTLSTIEFAPVLMLGLGLYFLIKANLHQHKISVKNRAHKMLVPIFLILISITWLLLALYVTESINPLKSTGLPGRWENWGQSLSAVILNIFRNPTRALATIANPIDKVYYFVSILAPVIFLVFLAPLELLLVLPWALAASLSQYSPYYEPYFQYFGFIVAQIFIAAVIGAQRLFKGREVHQSPSGIEKKLMAMILLVSFISAVAISPIGLQALTTLPVEINSHTNALEQVLTLIPSNASVATENDIESHLADRPNVFVLTWPMTMEVDYIILDLTSFAIQYGPTPTLLSPIEALRGVLDSGKYGVQAYADGVLLLKRGYVGGYALFKPYQESFTSDDLSILSSQANVIFDASSQSGNVIIHEPNDQLGTIWFGPYSWLFAGEYNVTFRMEQESQNPNLYLDVVAESWNLTTNGWSTETVSSRTLSSSDFASSNKWQDITLTFRIDDLERMEFRGWCWSNNTLVELDNIKVVQVGP